MHILLQIEQSFHRFKKRLHAASVRWVELKTGVVARNHSVHVSSTSNTT